MRQAAVTARLRFRTGINPVIPIGTHTQEWELYEKRNRMSQTDYTRRMRELHETNQHPETPKHPH